MWIASTDFSQLLPSANRSIFPSVLHWIIIQHFCKRKLTEILLSWLQPVPWSGNSKSSGCISYQYTLLSCLNEIGVGRKVSLRLGETSCDHLLLLQHFQECFTAGHMEAKCGSQAGHMEAGPFQQWRKNFLYLGPSEWIPDSHWGVPTKTSGPTHSAGRYEGRDCSPPPKQSTNWWNFWKTETVPDPLPA